MTTPPRRRLRGGGRWGANGRRAVVLVLGLLVAAWAPPLFSALDLPAPPLAQGAARVPTSPPLAATAGSLPSTGGRTLEIVGDCNASANRGPSVVRDAATGYLYATWLGCGGVAFARSIDGGYSFGAPEAVPPSTLGTAGSPSIAVTSNGTVLVAFTVDTGTGPLPYVAWSWDRGASFAGSSAVVAATSPSLFLRPSIAVAPNGTILVAVVAATDPAAVAEVCPPSEECYVTNGAFDAEVVASANDGATWGAPVAVDPESPNGGVVSVDLAVAPNGTAELLYTDFALAGAAENLSSGRIELATSADDFATASVGPVVANLSLPVDLGWIDGSIAVDPNGTTYVGYDAPNGTTDGAWITTSSNAGTTWSPPARLDGNGSSGLHRVVGLTANDSGGAYASWLSFDLGRNAWAAYVLPVKGTGSPAGAVVQLGPPTGLAAASVGERLGVVGLGGAAVGVAWSYGRPGPAGNATEVFFAAAGETPPVDPPSANGATPGPGTVTLGWQGPTASADRVDGYLMTWGLAEQRPFYNLSLAHGASYGTATGLPPGLAWAFEVAAVNAAGAGPFSVPVNVTLTAWGIAEGTVVPVTANVSLDGSPVTTVDGAYVANTTIGVHLLTVSASTYATRFVPLDLPWNGTVFTNVSLAELPGSVEGFVAPTNATVLFDGVAVPVNATGFYTVANVTAGPHVLAASATGYVGTSSNVTVLPGVGLWANLSLRAENGTLEVSADPASLHLTVGGIAVALNATGGAIVSLAPGTYAVTASATGYVAWAENVTILSASVYPLRILLNVTPAPTSPPPAMGFPLTDAELAGLAIVVVAAVGAGALLVRRRRRRGGSPPPSDDRIFEEDDPPVEPPPPGPRG